MRMRERMSRSLFGFCGMLLLIGLLGSRDAWGQGGSVKLEIRVDKVVAFEDGELGLGGNNEYRYDFRINNVTELELEMNDVDKDDLPKSQTFTQYNSIVRWVDYNTAFLLTMEAWEEDCKGDNTYNSCDDVHCKIDYIVDYTSTKPGVWHKVENDKGKTPLWCPDVHSAFVYFRWSPPKPPAPVKANDPVCKNEDMAQFTVPNHPQKQHVTQWQWQRGTMTRVQTYPTPSACYSECGSHTYGSTEYQNCVDLCLAKTPVLEDYFSLDKTFSGADEFSYKNNGEGLTVRYRQKYAEGVYSDWSDPVLETSNFYEATNPTSLETTVVDNDGNAILTNLVCGEQKIKLIATVPSDEVAKHTFYWYRNGSLITSTDVNEYTDTDNQVSSSQNTRYSVKTQLKNCPETYSSLTNSATVFSLQDAPSAIETDITDASCSTSEDGSVKIKNITGGTAYLYYNIAGYQSDGKTVERTTIQSSSKKTKSGGHEFTGLSPGNYVIQLINAGGVSKDNMEDESYNDSGYCAAEFEVTIEYRIPFEINSHTWSDASCNGGSDGFITIPFKNKEGDLATTIVKNDGTEITNTPTITATASDVKIDGLEAGTYTYTVTDSRNCNPIPSGTVTIGEPLALSLKTPIRTYPHESGLSLGDERSQISCFGEKDGEVTINPSDGNVGENYLLTLNRNTSEVIKEDFSFNDKITLSSLEEGHYTGFVVDCSGEDNKQFIDFTIAAPDSLSISVEEVGPITCHGVANGFIRVKAVGGVAPFVFWVDGSDPVVSDRGDIITLEGLDKGEHIVYLEDINKNAGSCPTATHTFTLEYPTPLNFELDSLVMPLCHGGNDGKLFIRPFGGNPYTQGYEVALTSPEKSYPFTAPNPSTGVVAFTNLPSGDYTVTIKDSNTGRHTCTVDSIIFLPQPTEVTVKTVRVTMPSCVGATDGSVSIRAEGGTPGENPVYYYSIDGINYVAPNEDSVAVFSNLEAKDYTFYAIDGHHEDYSTMPAFFGNQPHVGKLCYGSLNFTLDEPDSIKAYVTLDSAACYGTATGGITISDVTGGWGEYTYSWAVNDPGVPDNWRTLTPVDPRRLTDAPAGSYRLTVYDSAGCQSVVPIEIQQPERPLEITGVRQYLESCTGTTDGKFQVEVQGGWPGYAYQLDGGAYEYNNGFFEDLTAGAYLLTVRDRSGCEVRQMVHLGADELTVAVSDQLPATVGFTDGLLRLDVTGGQNKQYYLDGVLSTTGSEFSGLTAGVHTVAITYNGQCRWEQTYTIAEVAAPVPALRVTTAALQNVRCSNTSDGSLRVNITGGVPPYAMRWNDDETLITTERTNLAKGSYKLTVTDAAGVTLGYTATIDGPEPFEVINSEVASPACHQGADGYAEVTAVGGTVPYTYTWNNAQQQTTARASQLTAGTYTVTITDHNGCSLTQKLTVDPTPAPADVLEPQAITLCTGQSVTVDASPAWSTYQWTSDNRFSSTEQQIIINQAGRYFLQVTNAKGCLVYDTLELVTTDNLIDAEFLLPTEIVAGDTVVLTEVSWPAPEQTVWLYDEAVTTYQSDGEKKYVIFPEPGEYTIKLVVLVGSCMDEVEKKIIVGEASANDPSVENGRLGYVPKNEYLLYPNPNHGKFTLKVNISEARNLRVSVYDPLFKYRYHQQTFANTSSLEEEMDLTHLKHGVYTLMIETSDEIKIMRFVIR